MSAPSQTDLNNAYLDLQFLADIINGGPTETFSNRAGLAVKSIANAVQYIQGHASNPTFEHTTAQRVNVSTSVGHAHIVFDTAEADKAATMIFRDQGSNIYEMGRNADRELFVNGTSESNWTYRAFTVGSTGGFVVGGMAGGGDQGYGTINADAIYDNNNVLTCYVIEQFIHGEIDLQKWHDLVPNVTHYEYGEDGGVLSQKTIERKHDRAEGFALYGADRLDIDTFIEYVMENERLPAFPGPEHWVSKHKNKMSDGEIIQRLWETVEILAVFSMKARQRELAMDNRIKALEDAAAA